MPQQRLALDVERDPQGMAGMQGHVGYGSFMAQAHVVGTVMQQQRLPCSHVCPCKVDICGEHAELRKEQAGQS